VNRTDGRDMEREGARVSGIYAKYARSRSRRRKWSADNPGNIAIRDELFDELRAAAPEAVHGQGRVLDVGCGRGYWLGRMLAGGVAASRLHGIDVMSERLEAARLPPEVELRQADARRLPYPDQHFHLVLMFTVLSSLASREDARRALTEARRVAAGGGVILIYEPRIPQPLNRATLWIRRRDVGEVLGPDVETRTLTALPPLARRLGRSATRIYPRLSSCPALRTHHLMVHERLPS
jgi:ubiquinone/menaquinone biosynthesis C-methylase UbiE